MRLPVLLASLVLLGGCALGGARGPAPTVVAALPAPAPAAPPAAPIDRQLLVALPSAGAMLAGERIVVRPQADALAYLAGAVWPEPAPRMLQGEVVDALQRLGLLRAVERQGSGLQGDLTLVLGLQRLEIDYATTPAQARVEFVATLVDARRGAALAQQRFRGEAVADAHSAVPDARRLQALLADQVGALSAWLRATLPARPADGSSETSG